MLTKELTKKLRTGLTNFIASVFVSVLCLSLAIPVYADGTIVAEEVSAEKPKTIRLEHNGNPGFWFPRDIAINLQKDVEELQSLRSLVKLQDQQLAVKVERLTLQKEIAATNKEAAVIAKNELATAIKLRREAEEDRDSFFAGKPWFWVALGAIAGIVTSVVLVTQTKD